MPSKLNPDLICLKDMLNAINDIEQFMAKSSLDDRMTLMAVAYEIAIIGEAANNLSDNIRNTHAHIPWSDIIGMRHRIIHGYGKVNVSRLKEVVVSHLPVLKKDIGQMIEQLKS